MAKLTGSVALPPEDYSNYLARLKAGERSEHQKAADALFERAAALPPGVIEGAILKFPVADGYAMYLVTKDTGRTVEVKHIPYADAWQVHPALLRGLTRKDIVRQVEGERKLAALFAKPEKPSPEKQKLLDWAAEQKAKAACAHPPEHTQHTVDPKLKLRDVYTCGLCKQVLQVG